MKRALALFGIALALGSSHPAFAQKHYDAGVTDSEIRIGQTNPYSGPASAASVNGKMMSAYFNMVNAQGGIRGRKIKFSSLDDGYNPAKTFEGIRKLVEDEKVFAVFGTLGTPTNAAVQKYLNQKKVPGLLLITGAKRFSDPKESPYTIGYYPSYVIEASAYAKWLLKDRPNAKIALLYQNDDFGKDFVAALKMSLGTRASQMIVKEESYETSTPSVDSQVISLAGSGADVFVDVSSQKFGAQAIKKVHDLGWKPVHIIAFIASSVGAVLKPAGLDLSTGLITASTVKDPFNASASKDKEVVEYLSFMKTWFPDGDPSDTNAVWAYTSAVLTHLILDRCGDNLTRENLMKVATNLKDVRLPMLADGVKVNISRDNYLPVRQVQLNRFDGKNWQPFGEVIKVD